MAREKASVDRDKSYDLINPFNGQPQSAPDAERETAYYDQDEVTGTETHEDPYDNDDEVYNGIEKDTSRIADKRDHLGDAVKKGHMKKLSETKDPFSSKTKKNPQPKLRITRRSIDAADKVIGDPSVLVKARVAQNTPKRLRSAAQRGAHGSTALGKQVAAGTPRSQARGGLEEAENPMVASAPATSDSPMLGMYSMNTSNSVGSKYNLRSILESIALQAAETFEALDENATIPDSFGSELDQCSKAINKLYSFITQGQQDPQTGTTPVQGQNFMTKESYLNEAMYHATGYVYPHGKPEEAKEYAVPMSKDEINNYYDPTGEEFQKKVEEHNPHLTHDEAKAIADSGGDEVYKDHPTHTVENSTELKRIYENNELKETAKSKDFLRRTAALAGHPKKLEPQDFKALRQQNEEAKAKAKMAEAAFGVFGYILRNGR